MGLFSTGQTFFKRLQLVEGSLLELELSESEQVDSGEEEELEESEGGEDAELDPDQAQMVWPNVVVALPDKPPGALPDEPPEALPEKPPGALPDELPEALPDTMDTPPEA